MKKFSMILLAPACGLLSLLLLPSRRQAQCPGMKAPTGWAITSGFAMAIASAACGIAQARATSSACEGLARNPGAARSDPVRAAAFAGADRIDGGSTRSPLFSPRSS